MVSNVTPTSSDNWLDNNINKPKKNDASLISTFYDEFIAHELKWDKKDEFLREMLGNNEIKPTLKAKIETFAWSIDEFTWLEDKIKFPVLKAKLSKELIYLSNKRRDAKKFLLDKYDIKDDKIQIISDRIYGLNPIELDKLLNDKKEQNKLLLKVYWKNIPWERNIVNFFDQFNFLDSCNAKLTDPKLSPEIKQDIENIMLKFNNKPPSFTIADFQDIFKYNIFTKPEKLALIKTFVPIITLKEAEENNLWLDSKKIKKTAIEKTSYFSSLSVSDVEELSNSLSSKDITVSIDKVNIDANLDNICENLLSKNISKKIEEWIAEKKNELIDAAPKNLEEFKTSLLDDPKCKWTINKVANWSFIEIKVKQKWWEDRIIWLKITESDKKNIWMNDGEAWVWFNLDLFEWEQSEGKIKYTKTWSALRNYYDMKKSLQKDSISSINVIDKDELDVKEKNKSIEIISPNDLPEFLSKKEIDKKQEELMEKITNIKKEKNFGRDDNSDPEIEKLRKEFDKNKHYNLNELKSKLDEIDSDWELAWFEIWTGIIKWDNEIFWTIESIDEVSQKVYLKNNGKLEELSFIDFYNSFKEHKAKRIKNITGFSELIDSLSWKEKIWEEWTKYELKDNKIVSKTNKDLPWYESIKYLVWEKEDFIKINSISWDTAVIQHGIIKQWDKPKKEWEKIKETYELYKKETVRLSELSYYINKFWLKPRDDFTPEVDEKFERKWSFISKIFKKKSVFDIIAAWKITIDSFENYLKEWASDNAAKMANGIFGWVMPNELRQDLKARVQWEEKKRTDEYVEKLKKLDSWEATVLIKKRLLNSDCPQYKIEAGLIFMYEWYWWGLYAKELSPYMWTGLWYNAVWWCIWDEIWKKAEAESVDEKWQTANFTEEFAVFTLIKKQCWWNWYGNPPIKRRTRLHKEIKAMWPEWITSEIDKWYKDAKDTRSVVNMKKAASDEIVKWTHSCWFWWMKKMAERWGDLEDVWSTPIIAMFSWISDLWDQRLTIQMKDIYKWDQGNAIPMFEFMWTKEWAQTLSNVIVDLSRVLEESESYPDNKWIYSEAKAIFENRKKTLPKEIKNWKEKWWEEIKFEVATKFWEKHWKLLTRALHMTNWPDINYSKAENIVFLEKDKKWNEKLNEYYKTVRETISWQFVFTNKNYILDWLKRQGISWMNIHEAIRQWFKLHTKAFAHENIVPVIWDEVLQSIRNVRNNKDLNDNEKRKILTQKFTDVLSWIYGAMSDSTMVEYLLSWKMTKVKDWLDEIWFLNIIKNDNLDPWLSTEKVQNSISWNNQVNTLIKRKVDNYLAWTAWCWNSSNSVLDILDEKIPEPKSPEVKNSMADNTSSVDDIMSNINNKN